MTSITLAAVILWCWWSLFREYYIRAWIIFHNITSKYNSTFALLVFRLWFSILQMTDVDQWCKMNFFPRSSITSDLFLTFARFHARIFSSFSHSSSTAAFAAGIFIAWGIGINLCAKLQWCSGLLLFLAMWSSLTSGTILSMRSFFDSSASKTHAYFDLWSSILPQVTPYLLFAFTRHSVDCWNFHSVHSWWSLWIPFPEDQWSKFLSVFLHFRASVFLLPNFCFSSFLSSLTYFSRFLATNRASPTHGNESRICNGGDLSASPGNLDDLLLQVGDPASRWMFSVPGLLQKVWFVHLRLEKLSIFHSVKALSPLSRWVFKHGSRMRPSLPVLKVHNQYVSFPDSPSEQYLEEKTK